MGLAQAVGHYHWHPRRKLRYDRLYIVRMSPWLDIRVSVLCVRKVLRNAWSCLVRPGSAPAPVAPAPVAPAPERVLHAGGDRAGTREQSTR